MVNRSGSARPAVSAPHISGGAARPSGLGSRQTGPNPSGSSGGRIWAWVATGLGGLFLLTCIGLVVWVSWVVRDVPSAEEIRAAFIEKSGAYENFVYSLESIDPTSPQAVITTFNPRPLYNVNVCGTRQGLDPAAIAIPRHFVKLLLASEDNDFCQHQGYDLRGIAVALFDYIQKRASGDGGRARGASTITQQLAKNASCYIRTSAEAKAQDGLCDNERSIDRKVREIFIASQIESTFTKDEILALYLNSVRFWGDHQGLAVASARFFRVTPDKLSMAQSALLVGVLKASSKYSPTRNWDRAFGQASGIVLQGSRNKLIGNTDKSDDHLAITEAELLQARSELAPPYKAGLYSDAPWFAENVFTSWLRRTGQATPPRGPQGMKTRWITTLDQRMQSRTEELVQQFFADDPGGQSPADRLKADAMSIVILDRTGAVKAMIGGQRITTDQTDRATRRKRPPGSTIKPLIYALAIENGCAPQSAIEDRALDRRGDPVGSNGKIWNPSNAGGGHSGMMTIETGLRRSVNSIAVQLGSRIKLDGQVGMNALDRALTHHLSVSITDRALGAEDRKRQNALGVRPMSPLDMAVTFLPYLNEGRSVQVRGLEAVDRIATDGRYSRVRYGTGAKPFLSPRTAAAMVGMLHGAVNDPGGTGKEARVSGLDVIGKTGTTNDFRDAWFLGATNDLIGVVWVGRDDAQPMANGSYGGVVAAKLWAQLMSRIYESDMVRPRPPAFDLSGRYPDGAAVCMDWLSSSASSFRFEPNQIQEPMTVVKDDLVTDPDQ